MSRWFEPRQDQEEAWHAWVASRPDAVRRAAETVAPWDLYRMKSTGQIVTLYSLSEPDGDGPATATVNILVDPRLPFPMSDGVFGISLDDLEPYEVASHEELCELARLAAED